MRPGRQARRHSFGDDVRADTRELEPFELEPHDKARLPSGRLGRYEVDHRGCIPTQPRLNALKGEPHDGAPQVETMAAQAYARPGGEVMSCITGTEPTEKPLPERPGYEGDVKLMCDAGVVSSAIVMEPDRYLGAADGAVPPVSQSASAIILDDNGR